jgi:UDPglucose 6-dehydrogenase
MEECNRRIGDSVTYCSDMYEAAFDADALLVVTEWKEFRVPSWSVLLKTMNQAVILDGRNIYDRQELIEMGFHYYRIG